MAAFLKTIAMIGQATSSWPIMKSNTDNAWLQYYTHKEWKNASPVIKKCSPFSFLRMDRCASLPFMSPINILSGISPIPQPRSITAYLPTATEFPGNLELLWELLLADSCWTLPIRILTATHAQVDYLLPQFWWQSNAVDQDTNTNTHACARSWEHTHTQTHTHTHTHTHSIPLATVLMAVKRCQSRH